MSKFPKGKIGDLLTLQRGFDITKKLQADGPYPVVSSGGISSYHDKHMAKGPGVVIGRKGTLGTAFYLQSDYWPHDTTLWVKDFKGNDPKFIYYFLKKLPLENLDSGSANPTLNRNFVHQVETQIIPVDVQVKIAAVLSALDAKIDLNNRINAELEAMAKTLYDYWFVQFDFPFDFAQDRPDKNGKPYKSSGGKIFWNKELKREIPAGWEVGQLSDIANITMGQSPPGESYNESGDGTIFFQGCTDFGKRFPSVRQFTTQPTRFAKTGDILLSVRAPVGTMNIANADCCIGRGLAALNSKNGSISYLYGVMSDFKQVFERRNTDGTTFGAITKDDLFSLRVIKPGSAILEKFQAALSPAFDQQNVIEKENQHLSSLRDWLLPMLMNGQVTVDSNSREKSESAYDAEALPGELLPLAAEAGQSYTVTPKGK